MRQIKYIEKCFCIAFLGCSFIIATIVSIYTDPVALLTSYYMTVRKGSFFYQKMQTKIESFYMSLYIFNITNSERFIAGLDKNLKVEEVGPFVYKELRGNEDLEYDEETKILSYTPIGNVTFVPELSVGDPKNIVICVPNIVFLAFASRIATQSFWIKTAFELLSKQQRLSPVMNLTAESFIWGFDDPLIEMGKTFLPGVVYFDKLGILSYAYNPKLNVRYSVETTGDKRFQIKTVNGDKGFTKLGYDIESTDCNTFIDAYEGILMPDISPNVRIRLFHRVFCRLLELEYVKEVTMDSGMKALEFQVAKAAFDNKSDTECYCHSKTCYKGLWDLGPCLESLPVALSLPHYLDADERAFHRLEGLHPDPDKHGSSFLIQKTIGIPLKTHFSLQSSIVMGDVSYSSAAKAFSNMLVPICWGRADQLPLPSDIETILQFVTVYLPKIVIVFYSLMIICGTSLILYSLLLMYRTTWRNFTAIRYHRPVCARKKSLSSTEIPLMPVDRCDDIHNGKWRT